MQSSGGLISDANTSGITREPCIEELDNNEA